MMFSRILRDRSFVRISDEDWGELINFEMYITVAFSVSIDAYYNA